MARTYGLIGYPLGHSFSRGYFTDFFAQQGIDAEYKNFELPQIGDLTAVLTEETALQGFNGAAHQWPCARRFPWFVRLRKPT